MVDLVDIDLSLCPEFIEISNGFRLKLQSLLFVHETEAGAYRATIFQLRRVLNDLGQRFPKEDGQLSGLLQEPDNRKTPAMYAPDFTRSPHAGQ
jgi:hypothetical protein